VSVAISIPAICHQCGGLFPSGIAVADSASVQVERVSWGPCPACGGNGSVPDGVYASVLPQVLRLLTAPGVTVQHLKQLQATLERVRDEARGGQGVDPAKLAAAVREQAPVGPGIAAEIPKVDRNYVVAFITMILTAIGLVLAAIPLLKAAAEHPAGPSSVNVTVQEVFEKINADSAARAQKRTPVRRTGHKVGRNEPCPCQSGKKYKKCCAAPP